MEKRFLANEGRVAAERIHFRATGASSASAIGFSTINIGSPARRYQWTETVFVVSADPDVSPRRPRNILRRILLHFSSSQFKILLDRVVTSRAPIRSACSPLAFCTRFQSGVACHDIRPTTSPFLTTPHWAASHSWRSDPRPHGLLHAAPGRGQRGPGPSGDPQKAGGPKEILRRCALGVAPDGRA